MPTVARVHESDSAHWYSKDGQAQHTVIAKSTGLPRPTTIADARKEGWLPSVTTVLKLLNRPALTSYLIEQACLAVLTAPRLEGEGQDAMVDRVLRLEKEQHKERDQAADLGTRIHEAMSLALQDKEYDKELEPYVTRAKQEVLGMGKVVASEKVLVGDGYAGTVDLVLEDTLHYVVVDFKSAKRLPKQSYDEHQMQLGAYAKAWGNTGSHHITTVNIYISTESPGQIKVCWNPEWQDAYNAFHNLMMVWQWVNKYYP